MPASTFSFDRPLLHFIIIILAICMASILSGCTKSPNLVENTNSPTTAIPFVDAPTQNIIVTITPPQSPTRTHISTPTMTISVLTRTPRLTPTITPSLTPYRTPLPTLLPDQKRSMILKLLEKPGCLLPCWWGITPGQTTWQDVEAFLKPFADNISRFDSSTHQGYEVDFLVPKYIHRGGRLSEYFVVKNGLVDRIQVDTGASTLYSLANLLQLYGQPDQVWVMTFNSAPSDEIYFGLALYYAGKGILARYDYTASLHIDQNEGIENVKVCLGKPDAYPALLLLSSENQRAFIEIAKENMIIGGAAPQYKKLEVVTNMSVEEFYKKFKDSSKFNCIETPANQWPPPG